MVAVEEAEDDATLLLRDSVCGRGSGGLPPARLPLRLPLLVLGWATREGLRDDEAVVASGQADEEAGGRKDEGGWGTGRPTSAAGCDGVEARVWRDAG